MVPLVGALTPLLAMALAWRLYGPRAGLWAGLLLALMNAMVSYSSVGRVDHHVVEPLWLVLLLVAYSWSSAARGDGFRLLVTGALDRPRAGLLARGHCFLAAAISGVARPGAPGPTRVARRRARVRERCTAFAAVLSASSRWTWAGSFDYYALSLFQPAGLPRLLAVAARVAGVAAAGRRGGARSVSALMGFGFEIPRTALLRVIRVSVHQRIADQHGVRIDAAARDGAGFRDRVVVAVDPRMAARRLLRVSHGRPAGPRLRRLGVVAR